MGWRALPTEGYVAILCLIHSELRRKAGPYANAVLRFRIDFSEDYPGRPPVLTFISDVFHPLVTPVTTYTHSTRDPGTDTLSSADEGRLPPGGFALRHGFPEWFETSAVSVWYFHTHSLALTLHVRS